MYSFVSSHMISQEFKKSNLYKVNLGRALSVKKDERRVFRINNEDTFIKFYLDKYRSVIYSEGSIGKVNFFTDHHINGDIIMVFYNERDFIFSHNPILLKSKGINGYIGSFIEEIETNYMEEIEDTPEVRSGDPIVGNAENLFNSPGAVSYEDIQKFVSKNGPIRRQ